MLVQDNKITMSAAEFREFQEMTFAPWVPRTPEEFDAMCALGAARHRAEKTAGCGEMLAMAAEQIKFRANGSPNFPISSRHLAYVKVHGEWPTDEQLAQFEGLKAAGAGLSLVK